MWSRNVASRGSPIAPPWTTRVSNACPGAKRNSVPSMCTIPASSAAARRARAWVASCANGFSQTTCLPAATASSTNGPCEWGGVAIVTTSMRSSVSAPASVVYDLAMSKRWARAEVLSGSRPTSVHLEPGEAQRADMRQAPEPGAHDDDADAHAGIPAAFATIDSIVYWPTTNRISTSAGAS